MGSIACILILEKIWLRVTQSDLHHFFFWKRAICIISKLLWAILTLKKKVRKQMLFLISQQFVILFWFFSKKVSFGLYPQLLIFLRRKMQWKTSYSEARFCATSTDLIDGKIQSRINLRVIGSKMQTWDQFREITNHRSIWLSPSLSECFSPGVCPSVCFSLYLSLSLWLFVRGMSTIMSLRPPVSFCLSVRLSLSVCFCDCPPIC